jgi:VWFA-related protein
VLALVALGVLCVAAAVAGQQQADQQTSRFTETLLVDVVNVEVGVADRDGMPVSGLHAEDFEVLVDGKPVRLTNFVAAQAGDRPVSSGGSTEAGQPQLVILVDNRGGEVLLRNRVIDALAEYLPRYLAGGRRLALATQDREVKILHRFDDEPALLGERLAELRQTPVGGAHITNQKRNLIRTIDQTRRRFHMTGDSPATEMLTTLEPRGLLNEVEMYARSAQADVRSRLAVLSRFVSDLSGLTGPTALLYIGEGFETRPGETLFRVWANQFQRLATDARMSPELESGRFLIEKELTQIASLANAGGISCYTLLTASPSRLAFATSDRVGASGTLDRASEAVEDSLEQIAEETGGLGLAAGGEPGETIGRLLEEVSSFYSLGFEPLAEVEPSLHRIKVRVNREGLRVRHRETYHGKSWERRLSEVNRAALLFGPGPNPLEARIALDGVEERDNGTFEATVVVSVPIRKLGLVPTGHSHFNEIKIRFAVKDSAGSISEARSQTVPITVANTSLATALGSEATFALKVICREGPHQVMVTILDATAVVVSDVSLAFETGSAG